MGFMAINEVFMKLIRNPFEKTRIARSYRQGLIYFFEALSLHLRAGFSLSYSWSEVLLALGEALPSQLTRDLSFRVTDSGYPEGIREVLLRLQGNKNIATHQMWFSVLAELYDTGAGMAQSVEAVGDALRREQDRELEAYCRTLPMKINVVLILFFLPPTFLWIFAPLVIEILEQFK